MQVLLINIDDNTFLLSVCLHTRFFTDILKAASVTIGLCSSRTDLSAMEYQTVTKIASFLRGNDLPQFLFYLGGLFDALYQSHAIYQTDAMGVCHDCRFAKYITHDQISTFPANSGQRK